MLSWSKEFPTSSTAHLSRYASSGPGLWSQQGAGKAHVQERAPNSPPSSCKLYQESGFHKAVSGGLKPCSQDPGPHNPIMEIIRKHSSRSALSPTGSAHDLPQGSSYHLWVLGPPWGENCSWNEITNKYCNIIIKKNWKSAKCSQIGELINKIWYIHMIKHIRR